jgi:hypothetical protein
MLAIAAVLEVIMARVMITRHMTADPASVALLLAEPADAAAGGVVVSLPRRSGIGFTAAVEVTDPLGRSATGEVVVQPATDAGCEVGLALNAPEGAAARRAERAGSSFLARLAARARQRSEAA